MKLKIKKLLDFWIGAPGVFVLFPVVRLLGLTLRRNHDLTQAKSIAFLKLLGGGSLVNSLPTFLALKKTNKRIYIITTPAVKNFAEFLKVFDEILVIDDRNLLALISSSINVLGVLYRHVDVTVDLEIHSRLSTLFTTFSLVRSRVGLVDHNSLWRRRLYTHSIFCNPMGNITKAYDSIAELFSASAEELIDNSFWINQVLETQESLRGADCNKVCIGLGCSDLSPERRLTKSTVTQLVQNIYKLNPDVEFQFLGGPSDFEMVQDIIKAIPSLPCKNLCGQLSLRNSVIHIFKSKCFIGIDSALIHMSRYCGTPTMGFWGPTRPENLLRVLPNLHEIQLSLRAPCSPCVHFVEPPPCGGNNFCMDFNNIPYLAEWIHTVPLEKTAPINSSPSYPKVGTLAFFPDNSLKVLGLP